MMELPIPLGVYAVVMRGNETLANNLFLLKSHINTVLQVCTTVLTLGKKTEIALNTPQFITAVSA